MKIVGVIPAKSSSTRLSGKNTRKIMGVPLFLWAASNLARVLPRADIHIDSDGDDILDLAAKHGFGTIRRPVSLATNATDGNQLLAWEASQVEADIYIQHLPPMLFLRPGTIARAIEMLGDPGCNSVFGVHREKVYLWGEHAPCYDLHNIPNSFTLDDTIREGMGFYAVKRQAFVESGIRVAPPFRMIELDRFEAIDIDTPEDFQFAGAVARGLPPDSDLLAGIGRLLDARDVKLVIIDVDGTMTDGGMYYTDDGRQMKKFNAKDGLAIGEAVKSGLEVGFLSSGYCDDIVRARADTLGVRRVHLGRGAKIEVVRQWARELGLDLNQIAFLGDDVNDVEAMHACGVSACPSDSVAAVRQAATFTLAATGGRGCVREFFDRFLADRIFK